MTVTPDEAAKITDKKHSDQLKDAIAYFDHRLSNDWYTGRIELSVKRTVMDKKVALNVCRQYKDAGWKIDISSDQRDGEYWTFSKK